LPKYKAAACIAVLSTLAMAAPAYASAPQLSAGLAHRALVQYAQDIGKTFNATSDETYSGSAVTGCYRMTRSKFSCHVEVDLDQPTDYGADPNPIGCTLTGLAFTRNHSRTVFVEEVPHTWVCRSQDLNS
jgi:hypothetical protein